MRPTRPFYLTDGCARSQSGVDGSIAFYKALVPDRPYFDRLPITVTMIESTAKMDVLHELAGRQD
jgi:hypothetical protein